VDGRRIYDFKYFPRHRKYAFLSIKNFELIYEIYDEQFNLIDTLKNTPKNGSDVHEFQILNNGHYLIGGYQIDTVDLSEETFGEVAGSPKTPIKGFVIEEFDRNHELVFSWNSIDHIDPMDTYAAYGFNAQLFNYCHGNAIEQDMDGNFLISFRHLNSIYKISRITGEVMWILGGKRSHFTFPDDTGFSGQHDIRRLENGNITLFDNGNTSTPQVSRAVEYHLDTLTRKAHLAWEYIDSCKIFAKAMGNHQTTYRREHLINYGLSYRPDQSISLYKG
jgi:hypothetical protein